MYMHINVSPKNETQRMTVDQQNSLTDIKCCRQIVTDWRYRSSYMYYVHVLRGANSMCVLCVSSVILSFWKYVWNLILAYNSWTVRARTLIFQRAFLLAISFRGHQHFYHVILTLKFYKKVINLLITFEQWVLKLWYFTWVFYETRPFRGYRQIWPFDLDLGFWLSFWKH